MVDARRLLATLVGLALVTVTFWGPALALTADRAEYRAVELTTEGGTLGVEDPPDGALPRVIDGAPIACLAELRGDRGCIHEAGLLNGSRVVDHPQIVAGPAPGPYTRREYVAFGYRGPVYRRTGTGVEGRYRLGLERVPAATALRDVAENRSRAPPVARRAVETGRATTTAPFPGATIVATPSVAAANPRFHLVYQAEGPDPDPTGPGKEAYLEGVATLAGAGLLLRTRPPFQRWLEFWREW